MRYSEMSLNTGRYYHLLMETGNVIAGERLSLSLFIFYEINNTPTNCAVVTLPAWPD